MHTLSDGCNKHSRSQKCHTLVFFVTRAEVVDHPHVHNTTLDGVATLCLIARHAVSHLCSWPPICLYWQGMPVSTFAVMLLHASPSFKHTSMIDANLQHSEAHQGRAGQRPTALHGKLNQPDQAG